MYTISPLPDFSDSHTGFYALVVLLIVALVILVSSEDIGHKMKGVLVVVMAGVIAVAGNISYTPEHPANEKVTAHLAGFSAEGFVAKEGKHEAEHHNLYVTYTVPSGTVAFEAKQGIAYPQNAILYKN